MSNAVAEKYGYALFEAAKEADRLEEFEDQAQWIQKTVEGQEELQGILAHPRIRKEEKKALLEKIFEKDLSPEMMNFLRILVDKNRTSAVSEIFNEFHHLILEDLNIKDAQVITAVEATDEQLEAIRKTLEKDTGGTVRVHNRVDPSIMGGVIVEMDGRRLDNSIAHELEQLKFRLKQGSK